jgi:hypothetical protein
VRPGDANAANGLVAARENVFGVEAEIRERGDVQREELLDAVLVGREPGRLPCSTKSSASTSPKPSMSWALIRSYTRRRVAA